MNQKTNRQLSSAERGELLNTLEARFRKFPQRYEGLNWQTVLARLEAHPDKLWSLSQMEKTGGEPDLVGMDAQCGEIIFMDCAAESPAGRRSVCYDREALNARKENKPVQSAIELAAAMGISLLTEQQYRALQQLGTFDARTSSWLQTPPQIRAFGGAIFGDFRYGAVFVYHNGAASYYAARGFRGVLKI
jgi:hypothetical protein